MAFLCNKSEYVLIRAHVFGVVVLGAEAALSSIGAWVLGTLLVDTSFLLRSNHFYEKIVHTISSHQVLQ